MSHSNKNDHLTTDVLSATEHFSIFQFIVLVLANVEVLFCFTALINIFRCKKQTAACIIKKT